MATFTDGSSFVGVDGAAVTADEPVDTWLEHRVMSNTKWLALGRNAATLTFTTHNTSSLTTYTGTRPFTGVTDWNSVAAFPIYLKSGDTGFKLVFDYLAHTFGATQNDLSGRVRIREVNIEGSTVEWTFTDTTGGGGPEWESHTQTVTFDETYRGEDRLATVVIEIKGEKGDSYATETLSSSYIGQRQYFVETSANGEIATGTSGPSTDSYEVKMMIDQRGNEFELLAINPNITNPEQVFYWPNDFGPYVGADVTMYDVGFLSLRSISFQQTHEDDSLSTVEQSDLQANTVNLGRVGYDYASAIKRFSARPKLLSIGPPGTLYGSADETWPANYPQIWTFATGNGSNQMDALIDESLFIDRYTPKIKICMLVCGSLMTPNLSSTATSVGSSYWDLSVQFTQLQDGDTAWGTASYSPTASSFNAQRVITHSANPTNGRMLYQMALAGTFADYTTPSDHMFMYRDGQLLEDDFDKLQMVELVCDLSDFDTESTLPVRMELTASLDSLGNLPSTSGQSTSFIYPRLRLWCVGYSIWSVNDG